MLRLQEAFDLCIALVQNAKTTENKCFSLMKNINKSAYWLSQNRIILNGGRMALINTDWTKELEQVEATLTKLLDEKLEPMADRILDRGIAESSIILAKATFEIQDAIKQATQEIESQRKLAIKEIKHLIYYGGIATFTVIALTSVFIAGVIKYANFF